MPLLPLDEILLRQRAVIKSVHDQLKNRAQLEHSRHCNPPNFTLNLIAGLVTYTYALSKPRLDLQRGYWNYLRLFFNRRHVNFRATVLPLKV